MSDKLEKSFNSVVRSLIKLLDSARQIYPDAELVVLDGTLQLYTDDSEKNRHPLYSSNGLQIDGGGR